MYLVYLLLGVQSQQQKLMEKLVASNTNEQEKVLQEHQRKRKSSVSTSLGMTYPLDIKSMLSSPSKSGKSPITSLQRISPPPSPQRGF